jgi:N-carbamoyl-L-amino-acid hydrolase
VISLGALATIGEGERGLTRLAWTPEVAKADEWFAAQAEALGLAVERDPAGNLWACPPVSPPWWGVGSHLDTVREGGAYDGALGVAAGFEVARRTEVPVAVLSFADEEGARYNTPTFGSRALSGKLDPAVLDRVDPDGVRLADAMRGFGVDPAGVVGAPGWMARLKGFLELHIDQSREVWDLGVPVAAVTRLAARARVHVSFAGRADHAGTTTMGDRQDALAAAAQMIVLATDVRHPSRATATRILALPNALSTVPARVDLWLDGRASWPGQLDEWLEDSVGAAAVRVHGTHGVGVDLAVESRSDGVAFDERVRAALGGPEVVCFAGHDAGMLAEHIPAGMLLVRNERGVSHAPEEEVALGDAEAGVEALVRALEALA